MQNVFGEIITGIRSVSQTVDALEQIVGGINRPATGIGEITRANGNKLAVLNG